MTLSLKEEVSECSLMLMRLVEASRLFLSRKALHNLYRYHRHTVNESLKSYLAIAI